MSLKECYEKMGADYEDVLSRLRSEGLVRKFAVKFLDDDSYAALKDAMAAGSIPRRPYIKRCGTESGIWPPLQGGCTGDRGFKAV